MILVFGVLGFLLVQVSFIGLFSLEAAPAVAFVTMAVGLGFVGMAFSKSRLRTYFPYAMALVLAAEATLILPLSGIIWWAVLHYAFAFMCLGVGMRLASPRLWEEVLHPLRALHAHRARSSTGG